MVAAAGCDGCRIRPTTTNHGPPPPPPPPVYKELVAVPFLSADDVKQFEKENTIVDPSKVATYKVQRVVFTPDARSLTAGGLILHTTPRRGVENDRFVHQQPVVAFWELPSGKPTMRLDFPKALETQPRTEATGITGLALSPDDQQLWSSWNTSLNQSTSRGNLRVWSLATREALADVPGDSPKFHPNGRWVVCRPDPLGFTLDASTGKPVGEFKTYPYRDGKEADPIAGDGGWDISPDGGWIAFRASDYAPQKPSLKVVSTVAGRKPIELAPKDDPLGLPTRLFFTPDGDRLVGLSHPTYGPLKKERPSHVRCWSVSEQKVLWKATIVSHAEDIALSPDGHWVAVGCGDQVVRLLSAAGGKEVSKLEGHASAVSAVAFSKDGKVLASGDTDTIRVWKAQE